MPRQYSHIPSEKEAEEYNGDDINAELFDSLHCITCGKNFKNKKQLSSHEESKKHKANVALIQTEIEGDNANMVEHTDVTKDDEVNNFSSNPLFQDVNRGIHGSVSSYSLPDDTTLKTLEFNIELEQERENNYFEEPDRNSLQPTADSVLYLKLKGMSARRCATPVKEIMKSKSYSKFKDEEENIEASESLLSNDSMVSCRTRAGKKEIKDSAERYRMKTSESDSAIQVAHGKNSITDSMQMHKKRATNEVSKFKKKLFGKANVFNDG